MCWINVSLILLIFYGVLLMANVLSLSASEPSIASRMKDVIKIRSGDATEKS